MTKALVVDLATSGFFCSQYKLACENRRIFRLLLCAAEKYRLRNDKSRDALGMAHPEGNCVLIKILSVSNLLSISRLDMHKFLTLHLK